MSTRDCDAQRRQQHHHHVGPVNTDGTITTNRPVIIFKDSVNSTCKLIDMTILSDKKHRTEGNRKKKQAKT